MSSLLQHRIRQARERKAMTQEDLASAVGVALRTVGNWERGESVPRNRLAQLEDVLGVQLRDAPGPEPVRPGPQDADAERPLPVGSGVDPELLTELARADPAAIEAVRAVLKAARRGD